MGKRGSHWAFTLGEDIVIMILLFNGGFVPPPFGSLSVVREGCVVQHSPWIGKHWKLPCLHTVSTNAWSVGSRREGVPTWSMVTAIYLTLAIVKPPRSLGPSVEHRSNEERRVSIRTEVIASSITLEKSNDLNFLIYFVCPNL